MSSSKPYWDVDKLLIRTKDLIIVGAALWAIFVVGVKYYPLPGEVEAHAESLRDHEARIQKVENSYSMLLQIKKMLNESEVN